MYKLSINLVVVENFSHLREVPCEPLLKSHTESVNILVHLLNQSDALNNWLVGSVDILSTFTTREAVT